MRRAVLAIAFTGLLPFAARAQAAQGATGASDALAAGDRVRLALLPSGTPGSAGARSATGTLVSVGGDSIRIRDAGREVAVPRVAVAAISVSAGRESRGSSAWRATRVALAVGVLVGAIAGYAAYEPCDGQWLCFSRGAETAWGAVAFGVPAAAGGAAYGAMRPRERWRGVTLAPDTRVGWLATPRGAGVTLSLRAASHATAGTDR